MSEASNPHRVSLNTFTPAPGYILVSPLKDDGLFHNSSTDVDNTTQKAIVIKVGEPFISDFNAVKIRPCTEGDIILYNHIYANDSVEIDGDKYYIVAFDKVRGVFNAT